MNQAITEYNSDSNFDDDEIDLRQVWSVISRNKWKIIWLAATLTLLAIIILFSITPIYKAHTTIMLETLQANVVSIEQVYGIDAGNSEYYNSQIEVIKSRKIAAKVVKKLNLTTNAEFDPRQQTPLFDYDFKSLLPESIASLLASEKEEKVLSESEIFEHVVENVRGRVDVSAHKKSLIISITFEAASPELAAKVTDTIAKSYIENGFEARLEMTTEAISWLTGRLGNIKKDLSTAEKKLVEYKTKENLLDVQGVQTISAEDLRAISSKLSDARKERTQIESIYQQIKSIKSPTIRSYELIPGMFEYAVVQQAKNDVSRASQVVVQLSQRYGKKNPKMVAAKGDLSKARDNYLVLLKNIANSIKKKYLAAKANEKALKGDLKTIKSEIRNINSKSYKLRELEREVDTSRQLYETFFTRFKETSETSELQTANSRIIDQAVTPKVPVKPKKKLIVIIVFILGLGLGIVLAFVNEALNTTLKTPEDVTQRFSIPLLGALPLLKLKKKDMDTPRLAFINDNKSAFSEAVRTIRTGVVLSGLDSDLKIAVVTSSIPGEGKTTVAMNLALSLGAMEKVLLIDADLRRPSIAKACNLPPNGEGLSSLVAGTADFKDCIRSMPDWGIDILPAGIVPPNPQELLGSKRFSKLLEVLGKKYERIIIDTAPTQAVSDALLLAKHANEVIYVVKADATSYSLVKAGLDRLEQIDANVSGIILNNLDIKKAQRYSGDYYNGYYSNYGYS